MKLLLLAANINGLEDSLWSHLNVISIAHFSRGLIWNSFENDH